jgi:hypothetical protein
MTIPYIALKATIKDGVRVPKTVSLKTKELKKMRKLSP